jgi:hypothetical protein
MPVTQNLEGANNGGFLWPPIADALDTFLRRRQTQADTYERVWRLIHLWEAIEITLALAAMTRIKIETGQTELLRRQREFFYGRFWDPVTQSFSSQMGAAGGGIDAWINILDEVAKAGGLPGRYLTELNRFLGAAGVITGDLVSAWAKACDVSPDFRAADPAGVIVAMRCVNSFRNRFAHVPFPHDVLAEISDALETLTEKLFSITPLPKSHEKNGQSNPLTGAFRRQRCFLHGTQSQVVDQPDAGGEWEFVFPCQRRGDPPAESWLAGPVIHIDAMMRPHVLTRVKGHEDCEYTRFRAEANAVQMLPGRIAEWFPDLSKAEYQPDPEPLLDRPSAGEPDITMSDAIEAIRSEDYDTAINFFENLTVQRPDYHIGWLRLGHARREKAVRIAATDREEALRLLHSAASDLNQAAQHMDPRYQAVAHYERSKAFFHLARLEPHSQENWRLSKEQADSARNQSSDKKYQTWWEYLEVTTPKTVENSSA